MDPLYRVGQLWANLTAGPLSQTALNEVRSVLSEQEMALFCRMSASDQWHAYRVYGLLRLVGQEDGDLLAAALLHDVGKTFAELSAWDRSVAVLAEAITPRRADWWGDGDLHGWQRPFVVRKQHAAWGARLARKAGSRPRVVTLIARHQDTVPDGADQENELLNLLQWADNQH